MATVLCLLIGSVADPSWWQTEHQRQWIVIRRWEKNGVKSSKCEQDGGGATGGGEQEKESRSGIPLID